MYRFGQQAATVVLEVGDSEVDVEALLDTGAEVSVIEKSVVEAAGWPIGASSVSVLEGIAPGASKVPVRGRVTVAVRVAGTDVEGEMVAQVVDRLPPGFPQVLVGLDTLAANRWSVVWTDDGYSVAAARVAVVTVQDGEDEEVVYGAPAGVEIEDDGEETMPPPVLNRTEVESEIDARMEELGRDDVVSAGCWERLRALLKRRWRAMANTVGGVPKKGAHDRHR